MFSTPTDRLSVAVDGTDGTTTVPVIPVAPDSASDTGPLKCARASVALTRATPPRATVTASDDNVIA